MMRLPRFTYHAARSVREAAELLAQAPDQAMLVAGGTDVLPNMKRRQQTPSILVGLRGVAELKQIAHEDELTLGAGLTLSELLDVPGVGEHYPGLWQAAAQIATPLLRNMGTFGGNLCLDTRCNYYDQSYEWRKAINFCMKRDGEVCWVAPSSRRCLAVSSTDTAPMLVALGASVTLSSVDGERRIPVAALFQNDGIDYSTRRRDEIITAVHLPAPAGWRSAYWKLRRRGSFDFPVLSAAVAIKTSADGSVEAARIVLGAVASCPVEAEAAASSLIGRGLDDDAISRAAALAAQPSRPMDNTDFSLHWRKHVTREFVAFALRDARGDDMRSLRRKLRGVDFAALNAGRVGF
jgi:4-hydroxybenzoyl-CoA reductase subunit beta